MHLKGENMFIKRKTVFLKADIMNYFDFILTVNNHTVWKKVRVKKYSVFLDR